MKRIASRPRDVQPANQIFRTTSSGRISSRKHSRFDYLETIRSLEVARKIMKQITILLNMIVNGILTTNFKWEIPKYLVYPDCPGLTERSADRRLERNRANSILKLNAILKIRNDWQYAIFLVAGFCSIENSIHSTGWFPPRWKGHLYNRYKTGIILSLTLFINSTE